MINFKTLQKGHPVRVRSELLHPKAGKIGRIADKTCFSETVIIRFFDGTLHRFLISEIQEVAVYNSSITKE